MAEKTAIKVTERSIIFSADSIRAILSDCKTQTRRVIKNPDKYERIRECAFCCPYGQPGDLFWVRERFTSFNNMSEAERAQTLAVGDKFFAGHYKSVIEADEDLPKTSSGEECTLYAADFGTDADNPDLDFKWKSPIFMPRRASRITLEITNIRVERLQDISREDALAEGVREIFKGKNFSLQDKRMALEGHAFAEAWDALNAKRGYPWSSNPFVWVLEFKRLANA